MLYPLQELYIVLDLEKVIKENYGSNPGRPEMHSIGLDYLDIIYEVIPDLVIGRVSNYHLSGDFGIGYYYYIKYFGDYNYAQYSYDQIVEAANKYIKVLRNEPRLQGIEVTLYISLRANFGEELVCRLKV